jgi:stage II sporulation protein D
VRTEVGTTPGVEGEEPVIRVGVAVGDPAVTIGGGSLLLLSGVDGAGLTPIAEGTSVRLAADPGGVRLTQGGAGVASSWLARPADSAGFVRINGRDYRGTVTVSPGKVGLLVINELPLEEYVAGVVNAEMGQRPASDQAALSAQAVVSRSFAVRAVGRYRLRGYDVLANVSDQVYGGVLAESESGWAAVNATRGEVVSIAGQVAEVYFHSTCGGRTAGVDEVFSGSAPLQLTGVVDRAPDGTAYCAISPRFRWTEEWTGEQVNRILGTTLPAVAGGAALPAPVTDLQVVMRSPTNRVSELMVVGRGGTTRIQGQQNIRQVLRPPDGSPLLRSATFSLVVTRSGSRIVRVRADGSGAGHGVGMCQWGAVGRARAGASYRDILSAYFPGTEVSRSY